MTDPRIKEPPLVALHGRILDFVLGLPPEKQGRVRVSILHGITVLVQVAGSNTSFASRSNSDADFALQWLEHELEKPGPVLFDDPTSERGRALGALLAALNIGAKSGTPEIEAVTDWVARARVATGEYTVGRADHISRVAALHQVGTLQLRVRLSGDAGMHTSGWWKNPDYERCEHLSISFCDRESGENAPHDHKRAKAWCEAFFPDTARFIWAEPPFSDPGKLRDVWHYRVFLHDDWRTPILPRGEVYTREFTDAGWQSWSDLHAAPQEAAHT